MGLQRAEHDLENKQQNYTEKDQSLPSLPQLLSRTTKHTHSRFPQFVPQLQIQKHKHVIYNLPPVWSKITNNLKF